MSTENASFPNAGQPKKSSKTWLWVVLIGGGLLMTCCCGGFISIGGFAWYFAKQGAQASDRVHVEALAGGDLAAAYARATPEFKQKYTKEELVKLGQDVPELLKRDKWTTIGFVVSSGKVHVRFLLDRSGAMSEYRVFCTEDSQGKLQLVGIGPDLDGAVPVEMQRALETAGSMSTGGK